MPDFCFCQQNYTAFYGLSSKKYTFSSIVKLFYINVSNIFTICHKISFSGGCFYCFYCLYCLPFLHFASKWKISCRSLLFGIDRWALWGLPLPKRGGNCAFNISLTIPPHLVRVKSFWLHAGYQQIAKKCLKMVILPFVVWRFCRNFAI